MRFYLASGLGNADVRNELARKLEDAGWVQTYDWTVHGSVQDRGHEVWRLVASDEADGVLGAAVVIALMPGGRGTHTELGMAIGMGCRNIFVVGTGDQLEQDGRTCVFYHHPRVTLVDPDGCDVARTILDRFLYT